MIEARRSSWFVEVRIGWTGGIVFVRDGVESLSVVALCAGVVSWTRCLSFGDWR